MAFEHAEAIEVRFTSEEDGGRIEGCAVRFNVVDSYRTTFAPEAFTGLEGRTVPMLWSHDPSEVIGSWTGFRTEVDGLMVTGKLNLDVQRAREARAMLIAGDVRGLSIGFTTTKSERRGAVRRITSARLHEISLTAFAAVPGSRVTAIRTDDRNGAAIRLAEAARAAARAFRGK